MAATTKGKPEGLLGLSHNEARLILLGILYTDASGKVCYARRRSPHAQAHAIPTNWTIELIHNTIDRLRETCRQCALQECILCIQLVSPGEEKVL